ncbi:hypothetical protein Afil01_08260 [Actinorhabdospora filicis]|uniref:LysR substrate-binding domain-containing protein n=1 Tax=Actinorhabdospora filicis TaxID=1785913 RepID=A0A9W6SF37_9ACTN|nr:LysR substrate-binding domain-containing protein [Actinorhabdospora filicis]GLZ76019.1 hypothetical protein Afil01_08260 [Actinorhabdospora filicis]
MIEVRAGTTPSLAPPVFAALEGATYMRAEVRPSLGEPDGLLRAVAAGELDGAVVPLGEVPDGTRALRLGHDRLVLVVPRGIDPVGPGRRGLSGRRVVLYAHVDAGALAARLERAGAEVRRAVTAQTALAMARRSGTPAVVPGSTALWGAWEEAVPSPVGARVPLGLVVPVADSAAGHVLRSSVLALRGAVPGPRKASAGRAPSGG